MELRVYPIFIASLRRDSPKIDTQGSREGDNGNHV